jgi:hypothetical protein
MIRETIAKIEERLKNSATLNDQTRQELVSLLGTLKKEVTELSKTDTEHAARIAGYAETSAEEATRPEPNPETLKSSIDSLSTSVEGFETSHPGLVQIVNRIATMLSNLGI